MKYPLLKPRYYLSLLKELVAFLKAPRAQRAYDKSSKQKIYDTIGLIVLKMVFLIPVILFFALVYDPENILKENMSGRFTFFQLLLVGGVVLPLIEKVAFRLSLKYKPVYLALSSGVLCYYIITKAIFHTKISATDESFPIRISIALFIGFIIFMISNVDRISRTLTRFWDANFTIIFYTACLVFAFIHITKYELIWLNIILLPILTLPQLFSAIIYGYTRVAFGFRYPLLLHMSMNSLAIGLSALS
ncbi:MAG: hypothetical protein WBB45_13505 [Cyclobacteriaceae bacterium]